MENKTAFGIAYTVQNGADFELFAIGIHYHKNGTDSHCQFRRGVIITILGMSLSVGIFSV